MNGEDFMTVAKLPLYGRFNFPGIEELADRLKQVSAEFMGSASFSAYMTTYEGGSFYGLDYEELLATFSENKSIAKLLAASCSGPEGKSVSVNIRFSKNRKLVEGQYVIVSGSKFKNNQISSILRGEWIPETDEDIEKQIIIEEILRDLLDHKEREAAQIEKEKLEAEIALRAKQMAATRAEKKSRVRDFQTIRDSFYLDEDISVNVIINLLDELSVRFLYRAPFNIRVVTLDGESYSDIGVKGLRRFFDMRRRVIKRVYMDAATTDGELVDILLVMDPEQRPSVKMEITAEKNREIREKIRNALLFTRELDTPVTRASMLHEMFRFSQDEFSVDLVIRLISAISNKYLQKEPPTAFLSTLHGETYPALNLRQLKTVYKQQSPHVSFLLFGINQSVSGRTFSLMFQFQSPGHDPYGSLSMMWGDHEIHQMVRALIWEQLKLNSYRIRNVDKSQNPEPAEKKIDREISITPVFQNRNFNPRSRTGIIIMPLEAYWSESLWIYLSKSLASFGYESARAEALFSENVLEDTWTSMYEVDLVVADLTYKHPDVFYKLGIAHTLGKKVILISQHARDIPKDFLKYPHIVYDNNINGLKLLNQRLEELLKSSGI